MHTPAQIKRAANQRRIFGNMLPNIQEMLDDRSNFPREFNQLMKENGNFGSKDRRLYRELTYSFLRIKAWIEPIYNAEPNLAMDCILAAANLPENLRAIQETSKTVKELCKSSNENKFTAIAEKIGREDTSFKSLIPEWALEGSVLLEDPAEQERLFSRPPLWIRLQGATAEELNADLEKAGKPTATASTDIENAMFVAADTNIQGLDTYRDGHIEIQDIGSQALLHIASQTNLDEKKFWLDACAGAGGKSLQIADHLKGKVSITSFDVRNDPLRELYQRAKRSRHGDAIKIVWKPEDLTGSSYDVVLVDAPCSASGTWRRHPYLMWQLSEKDVKDHSRKQFKILNQYANFVKPGGSLIYCTCSLFERENGSVISRFISENPKFEVAKNESPFGISDSTGGVLTNSSTLNGDCLYVAVLTKKSETE